MPVASGGRPRLAPMRSGPWSISNYLAAFSLALLAPALIFCAALFYRYIAVEQAQLE